MKKLFTCVSIQLTYLIERSEYHEMKYALTISQIMLIRELYAGIKDVVVPEMFTNQSTSKVLVMQWVEVLLYIHHFSSICLGYLYMCMLAGALMASF